MARPRSPAADFAVYLAVRLAVCVLQALPWAMALGLARVLAWVAWRVDRRHRAVAEENIRHAFPELTPAAVDRLTRASYLHLTTMVVEMTRLPRVLTNRRAFWRVIHYAVPGDHERAVGWAESGRPALILTGHFGNWEALSYALGAFGYRAGVVARRLDNPYLDRFLVRLRQKTGQQILDKSRDYDRIEATLAGGGYLGMVGDQDAGPRGLFVDFLGRPASTFKSIALLSLTYSAPILVFGAARLGGPLKYRLYLEDVILPEEYAAHPDPTRAVTARYTDALARMVRRHPEQYFWLHRRWKHQPPVRRAKAAA
jgi:KDO2-lipid IV(A) lauroyltransferase